MNYINSSASHWFVFCEALYLFRLLRAKAYKDRVRWYILTGWRKFRFDFLVIWTISSFLFQVAPLILTLVTYATRYRLKTNLYTCWFEPSHLDWILHGPNVILQLVKQHERRNFSFRFFDLVQRHHFHLHL